MGEVFYFFKTINKLVCSVKLLVMYGDNLFGRALMKRLTKEGNNIICADKQATDFDKKIAASSYALDYSNSVDEIFRIHNLEGVIFIGDTLIDGNVPYSNGDYLEKVLSLCEEYKLKQFMYVTQAAHEANENFVLRSRVDKYLCQEYAERGKTSVKIIEFDNFYAVGANCGIVLRMLKAIELGTEWEEDFTLNLFYLDDAVDAVCRIWQGAVQATQYLVHNPKEYVQSGELFACLSALYNGNNGIIKTVADKSQEDFLSDVNWKPKYNLQMELPKIVHWFSNRDKDVVKAEGVSFMAKLRPYVENLCLFGIVAFISIFLQDGSSVNQYTGVDFAYLYIIIMGLLYGKRQAAPSIVLSCMLLIYKYLSHGSDWIGILYQTQPMVHMATYLFMGTLVGYITDNKKKTFTDLKMQYKHLQGRFDFLYNNYLDTVGIKDVFYRQILNTSDSVGKIYNVITKLESVRREELYCAACEVVSEFLGVEDVAIYTTGRSPYYLRLRVRQGEACGELPKSLKVEANPYLEKMMAEHTVFLNKKLEANVPDMAAPILYDDKVLAVIHVYNVAFERFSLQSEIMLKVVSLLIASAIRKAALYEESIRAKMYLPETRIYNKEHFAYHLQEASRQHELDYRTFQKAQLVTFKGKGLDENAGALLEELSAVLDRIIRDDDIVGVNETGELEALLFNLPEEFKDSVNGRFVKEGIEIRWISQ